MSKVKNSASTQQMLKDRATVLIHVIFSTKRQQPFIDEKIAPLLYSCIEGVLWDPLYSPALKTGGGSEHVHILLALSRTVSPDSLIKMVKVRSAAFVRTLGRRYKGFDWQEGYAAFTISRSEADELTTYIARQKAYHKSKSFQDEYRNILTEHGIEYDEDEMWD